MENFHLIDAGSRQNQVRSHLGGLAQFSYEYIIFLWEFLKEGQISATRASPPNRASSPPYEQPLFVKTKNASREFEFFKNISFIKSVATKIENSTENLTYMIYERFILELFVLVLTFWSYFGDKK